MPLIYSFVSRGTVVLADYTAYSGNFAQVAVQCLEKVPTGENTKFTLNCDRHNFNFHVDSGFTFLAVAPEKDGRQVPFAFLDKLRAEFKEKFADKARTATAHSLDKTLGPRLKHWMEFCAEHPEDFSKTAGVQKKIDEVKNIMVDNIERVLERGEKIELLVDKTDNLRFQADRFHKTGRQLRTKMWWQQMKLKIIVALVILVLIFVVFCLVCFSGGNCLKH